MKKEERKRRKGEGWSGASGIMSEEKRREEDSIDRSKLAWPRMVREVVLKVWKWLISKALISLLFYFWSWFHNRYTLETFMWGKPTKIWFLIKLQEKYFLTTNKQKFPLKNTQEKIWGLFPSLSSYTTHMQGFKGKYSIQTNPTSRPKRKLNIYVDISLASSI